MTGSGGFTQTIDWLAFTLPKAEVDDVIKMIGGDWFQSETGFRGYPVAQTHDAGQDRRGQTGDGCASQSEGSACGSLGRDCLPVG